MTGNPQEHYECALVWHYLIGITPTCLAEFCVFLPINSGYTIPALGWAMPLSGSFSCTSTRQISLWPVPQSGTASRWFFKHFPDHYLFSNVPSTNETVIWSNWVRERLWVVSLEDRVGKNRDLKKNQKIGFLLFKSVIFDLNQIRIYIRISIFFLGYCSYNRHDYVNNLEEQVCNQARLWFLIVYLKVTNDSSLRNA